MRVLLLGLLTASLVLTTPGCAFFRALFGLDGPPEPTAEELAAAAVWEDVTAAAALVAELPPANGDDAFETLDAAHLTWEEHLARYAAYCGDVPVGAHCGTLENARADMRASRAGVWASAVSAHAVSFDGAQSILLRHQHRDAWATLLDLNTLMPQLAAKKQARWVGELETHKRPADYVRATASPLCLPLAADRGKKPRKLVTMDFDYEAGETVWIRCFVANSPRTHRRDTPDTWVIKARHEGRWETLLEQEVKRPSSAKTLHHALDGLTLRQALVERAGQQGWAATGGWVDVKVVYVVRAIATRRWVDGVWQDEWREEKLGATSFLVHLPGTTPEPEPAPEPEPEPAPEPEAETDPAPAEPSAEPSP